MNKPVFYAFIEYPSGKIVQVEPRQPKYGVTPSCIWFKTKQSAHNAIIRKAQTIDVRPLDGFITDGDILVEEFEVI